MRFYRSGFGFLVWGTMLFGSSFSFYVSGFRVQMPSLSPPTAFRGTLARLIPNRLPWESANLCCTHFKKLTLIWMETSPGAQPLFGSRDSRSSRPLQTGDVGGGGSVVGPACRAGHTPAIIGRRVDHEHFLRAR